MSESLINNRYRIVDYVGTGGTCKVFKVRDEAEDNQVRALKILNKDHVLQEEKAHFRNEYRILSDLDHPNIEKVFNFGEIQSGRDPQIGSLFFSAEFIDGQPFRDLPKTYTWEEILELVIGLVQALQVVHNHNLIHGDIKPGNILVYHPSGRDQMKEGMSDFVSVSRGKSRPSEYVGIKLIDFGLTRERGPISSEQTKGTAHYISPEMIQKDHVDHRSDFYSLGITLYEVFYGAPPFTGSNASEVLNAHLNASPPRDRPRVREFPERLNELIFRLISRSPDERPQNADQLIRDLQRVRDPKFERKKNERSHNYFSNFKFVNREEALQQINSHLSGQSETGKTGAFLITGESGIGKTRVLREIRVQLETEKRNIVFSSLKQQDSQPLSGLRELFHKFLCRLQIWIQADDLNLDEYDEHLRVLKDFVSGRAVGGGHGGETRAKSYSDSEILYLVDYLSDLLLEISSRKELVLILDDLQNSDTASLQLLSSLFRKINIRERRSNLSCLFSLRTDRLSGELEKFLEETREWEFVEEVSLKPISRQHMIQFADCLFNDREFAEDIVNFYYTGNPGFFLETLRNWYVRGSLKRTGGGWHFDRTSISPESAPEKIQDLLWERVGYLEEEEKHFLLLCTLWGENLSGFIVESVFPEPLNSRSYVQDLEEKGLIHASRGQEGEIIHLADPSLGDLIKSHLPVSTIRSLTNELLNRLETAIEEGKFGKNTQLLRLAQMSWETGNWDASCEYAMNALRSGTFEHRTDGLYRLLKELRKTGDVEQEGGKQSLIYGLFDLAIELGYVEEADRFAEEFLKLENRGSIRWIEVQRRRGKLANDRGDPEQAMEMFRELADLWDQRNIKEMNQEMWNELVRSMLTGVEVFAYNSELATAKQLMNRVKNAMGCLDRLPQGLKGEYFKTSAYLESRLGNHDQASRDLEDHIEELETKSGDVELGELYNELGGTFLLLNHLDRAEFYFEKARGEFQKKRDLQKELKGRIFMAQLHMKRGSFEVAYDEFMEQLQKGRELGLSKVEAACLRFLSGLYEKKGELKKALEYAQKWWGLISETDNRRQHGAALNIIGMIYLSLGNFDEALSNLETSYDFFESTGDKRNSIVLRGNKRSALLELGEIDQVAEISMDVRTFYQETEDYGGILHNVNPTLRLYSFCYLGEAYQTVSRENHDSGDSPAGNREFLSTLFESNFFQENRGSFLTRAREEVEEAMRLKKKKLPEEPLGYTLRLLDGRLYLFQGNVQKSMKVHRGGLEEAKKKEGNEREKAHFAIEWVRDFAYTKSGFVESTSDRLFDSEEVEQHLLYAEEVLESSEHLMDQIEIKISRLLFDLVTGQNSDLEEQIRTLREFCRENSYNRMGDQLLFETGIVSSTLKETE